MSTVGDYKLLSKEYDYVVIANGDVNFTKELGCWFEWVNTSVRGAVVLGDFDPNTLTVWVNKKYCKYGYAYLTPYNNRKASLNLVVTDVNLEEVDRYWELFIYTENIKYKIVEEFKDKHISGHVYPHRVGNLFLAGNAGGMLDPFLGFGVVSSIVSGVMAARSIVRNKDYEKLLKEVVNKNIQLYEFRKAFNKLENPSLDVVIQSIGLPIIKHLMYYTPLNVVKHGANLFKLTSKKKEY